MPRWRIGGGLLGAFAVTVYLFMLAPVIVIVLLAFDQAEYASLPPSGWTLRWFAELARDSEILQALKTSLILGLTSSAISTVIGTAAAYAIARFRFIGREAIQIFLTLPVLVPHIILGVGLLLAFRMVGLTASFPLLVIGHVAFTLPFVMLTTGHRLLAISQSYE
ncbi:MAG: ABC transporter permease, partial [Alphaproteobacteria bacterium]|nr:ABC transporter permease [Alphaproteobacteria bacterium]